MASKVSLERFLSEVEKIAYLHPSYRSGGSGADGSCDCIGLVIGAIRQAGGAWPGLHGSNYAARSETEGLSRIDSAQGLRIGELVYKAREPGEAGYALPDKYRKGGKSCTGDLRDYYHVGIVTGSAPLRIRHMSTPGIQLDTAIGKWKYHGWCKRTETDRKTGEENMQDKVQANTQGRPQDNHQENHLESTMAPVPSAPLLPTRVTIESTNGLPVKLRAKPSTFCGLYWEIASGAGAELLSRGDAWCRVRAMDRAGETHEGWIMTGFVVEQDPIPGETPGQVLSPDQLLEILQVLAEVEQKLDQMYEILGGRG